MWRARSCWSVNERVGEWASLSGLIAAVYRGEDRRRRLRARIEERASAVIVPLAVMAWSASLRRLPFRTISLRTNPSNPQLQKRRWRVQPCVALQFPPPTAPKPSPVVSPLPCRQTQSGEVPSALHHGKTSSTVQSPMSSPYSPAPRTWSRSLAYIIPRTQQCRWHQPNGFLIACLSRECLRWMHQFL